MAFQLPEAPQDVRRARIVGWVSLVIVLLLILLLAYLAWVGFVGSGELVEPPNASTDCRTPESAFGWTYEAMNYPVSTDERLASNPDRTDCAEQGAAAGAALTASDGVRLAGWYISAARTPSSAPTIVVAHASGANKSEMLEWAQLLHDDYNLVLFDFRNHGQSGGSQTTGGSSEQRDVRAIVDWLQERKGATRIGLLGVSMGGAAAVNEAASDRRIGALVLDSTHATLANAIQAELEHAGYPLALPGAWSVLLGGLLRTGQDMSAADPVQAIERYGDDGRPVLLLAGGRDDRMGATAAGDMLTAAEEGGAAVELQICDEAGHQESISACPDEYRAWVLGFLDRSL